jgi:hypothetical protein
MPPKRLDVRRQILHRGNDIRLGAAQIGQQTAIRQQGRDGSHLFEDDAHRRGQDNDVSLADAILHAGCCAINQRALKRKLNRLLPPGDADDGFALAAQCPGQRPAHQAQTDNGNLSITQVIDANVAKVWLWH